MRTGFVNRRIATQQYGRKPATPMLHTAAPSLMTSFSNGGFFAVPSDAYYVA